MSLTAWLGYGWLIEHRPTAGEIRDLFALIERDLADCEVEMLSADWRLGIAYNAALQAAMAALAACGYRPAREAHHYRTIQSLPYTIGSPPNVVVRLDLFRKKRNLAPLRRELWRCSRCRPASRRSVRTAALAPGGGAFD